MHFHKLMFLKFSFKFWIPLFFSFCIFFRPEKILGRNRQQVAGSASKSRPITYHICNIYEFIFYACFLTHSLSFDYKAIANWLDEVKLKPVCQPTN